MNALELFEQASSDLFGIWFLMGAVLVFFMQAGFAMVETGFTRAKNAGNIIMKNLMDFCIGTVVFLILGFNLMMAEDTLFGFIGIPNLNLFNDFANFPWSSFIFNLVFCATAATIVSGAMAERTKFNAYLIYSAVISCLIYPIEAGWVWNGSGWLFQMGFVDFAGSAAIHMVGGVSALIGAKLLGPRIGKYVKDKDGKTVVRAIPGHSLTLGALGVFILWFGWYGFNGAAATEVGQLAQIFSTTTIAAGFATVTTMIFTWLKNGKPDVSMTLNGSLAGLVAITAPCANVDALGAIIIGIVAGFLVVLAVEFLDMKLHIDDPVGAVAVHGVNGIWGTLAVGLFNIYEGDGITKGLFYGGGAHQLITQLIGVVSIAAWTAVTMYIVFSLIKKTNGLRVSPAEEIEGLDVSEHGLASSYADFMPVTNSYGGLVGSAATNELVEEKLSVPVDAAVPVQYNYTESENPGAKITKVTIITRQSKFEDLKRAMNEIEVTGMTVIHVVGCGLQKGSNQFYRGVPVEINLLPKIQVEIVVTKVPVEKVVEAAKKALYTGNIGDGKIFIYNVEDVIKIRTGETGYDAMQGEE
ncbi:ammonia channel precursor [Anaerotignum neopropionicum]|uniref:Ammonia channel n=1 Tax=Anaerotignum neopropionicum TaxID=36847 RepID=A0A136WGT4_9FIRM|nr:ammonium transporter [Anaerotignum neopropionicum]KXL53549.1 ammonia channel precursor [Anaerotignum neopropionicum]